MILTDDPLLDFAVHDRQQEEALNKRPVCCYCGEPIQDDFCYEINGDLICADCLDMHFRKAVDDIIS